MVSINKFGGVAKDSGYYYENEEDDGKAANALHLSLTDPDAYDAAGKRIVGLGEPKDPNDAATFFYLENRLMDISKDAQRHVSKYSLEKSVFNADIKSMNEKLAALQQTINSTNKTVSDLKKDVAAGQSKINSASESVDALKKNFNENKRRIDAIEPTISSSLKNINHLQSIANENEHHIYMYGLKIDSLNKSISAVNANFLRQESRLSDLESQVNNILNSDSIEIHSIPDE